MIQTLVQYFIKNGHLDLPSIGILKWSKQASYWENNKFIAPKEFIDLEFTEVTPSKHFYSFLSDELNISVEQANVQFESFLQKFSTQAIASLNFGNLGTLHKNQHVITWNNLYNAEAYYQDLEMNVSPVFLDDHDVNTHKKDLWWVWALVLVAIAAGLIIYKQL